MKIINLKSFSTIALLGLPLPAMAGFEFMPPVQKQMSAPAAEVSVPPAMDNFSGMQDVAPMPVAPVVQMPLASVPPAPVSQNIVAVAPKPSAPAMVRESAVKKSGGFSTKVLIERIRVQLRKKDNVVDDTKNIISHGKLKLDPAQLECEWNGKALPDKLTTTEFLIVKELAKRPGVIKERAHLMDIAYKENTEIEDRTIDSHVKRIRKKFKKVDEKFSAIETRYGSGYRWNVS